MEQKRRSKMEIKHSLGEKAIITVIGEPCLIVAIEWSLLGIQYKGVYWINGKREETWFYQDELK
jgi:hypothetical protein